MEISEYSVDFVKDPFQILTGQRYEFILDVEIAEDDELYTPQGLYIRVIYLVEEGRTGIVKHEIRERGTERLMDFELEDEELQIVEAFCAEHLPAGK